MTSRPPKSRVAGSTRMCWSMVVATLATAPAIAQDASDGADDLLIPIGTLSEHEEIDALRNRLRALEEQFDALQAEDSIDESALPLDLETKIHGYADVFLSAYRLVPPQRGPDGEVITVSNHPPGFQIGDLVLSYNANLDRRVYATIDLVYGPGQFGNQLALLDRVDLQFDISDAFKIKVGKIQSPFGYWNTNIPYGGYLYATAHRPQMLTFERHGAFITTRQTGIDIHGDLTAGFWRWGYHVGIGNGRSAQLSRTQDVGDGSAYKTTWLQLWVESPGGLQVGFTAMYDPLRQERLTLDFSQDLGDQSNRVNTETDARNPVLTTNVDEYMFMPHIAWRKTRMEFLAEAAVIIHNPSDNRPIQGLQMNYGAYAQWSHRFHKTTPYVRGEFVEWWREDPVFLDLGKLKTRAQGTIGVRQEVALHAAVKFEAHYINEMVYKHPNDPTYLDPHMDEKYYIEGINDTPLDRIGGVINLSVGF